MTNKQAGGPAFPCDLAAYDPEVRKDMQGMTLRDYFAIRAFQTRLSKHHDWTLTELTEQAYQDADAMLKARQA